MDAKPVETVNVVPMDYTPNQFIYAIGFIVNDSIIAPLALRALLKNFGIEWTYGKCWRTIFAAQAVAGAVGLHNRRLPAARGKTLKERARERDETVEKKLERLTAQIQDRKRRQQGQGDL